MKLILDHIQAKGLKDTSSLIDIQDPIIHINIGKIFLTTEKKNNCRTDANFDAVLTAEVTADQHNNDVPVQIEVWNEGTWGTKHVGRGTVGLKTAINALNQHFSFVVPLIHYDNNGNGTKGKPHGEVIVRGYLAADVKAAVSATATADPAPQPAPIARAAVSDKGEKSSEEFNSQSSKQSGAVYDETKPLVLRLDQLQARGLKDKGGTWDKQDPALRITVGDAKPFDTERVKDAGVDADFPEQFELEIPAAKFTNNLAIEVEAFNIGSAPFFTRTSLGKTRVPLRSLVSVFNEHVPVTVDLLYDSQKTGPTKFGRVMMRAFLQRPLKPVTPSASAAPAASAAAANLSSAKTANPTTLKQPSVVAGPEPAASSPAAPSAAAPTAGTSSQRGPTAPAVPAAASQPATFTTSTSTALLLTHHLFISEIKARDLKNVEMVWGDRNDPYVQLTFGTRWDHRTPFIDGAGSSATWRYERAKHGDEMRFPATQEELTDTLMQVVVTDKNQVLADKLIGSGSARLPNALMPAPDLAEAEMVHGEMLIPIHDEHGKASGMVVLQIERETTVQKIAVTAAAPTHSPAPAAADPVAADFSKFKHSLFVSKIRGKGLKNVEMMPGDKDDPYMLVKFGRNTWSCTTSVLEEAGSDPSWEYNALRDPHMKFSVSLEELRSAEAGVLQVTAMDKNHLLSDALIGKGQVALPSIPGCTPAQATEEAVTFLVAVPLVDGKGKVSGSVELTVERSTVLVERKPQPEPAALVATSQKDVKPFDAGTLLVTRIVCQDLPSVEIMGGKNDVFVVLQLGAEERKTETIDEGGVNVCFDFLDFAFDVDKGVLDFEAIKVHVSDQNAFSSNKLIGRAESSLRFMVQKVDEEGIQLPLTLKNEKGKDAGKVILFLTLKPAELKTAEELPLDPSFHTGLLHINRVRAFELQKPKSMLGSSSVGNPYLVLGFGSWKYKTQPLSVADAGSPIFDNLDLAPEVTAAMLQGTKLVAEVYDKGLMGDTLVGRGQCCVREAGVKVGQERQFTIDLANKGATAGKLVVYALAAQKKHKLKKSDVLVDKAYEQGFLQIKAITAHSLKNTELMIGDKQDPFVIVEFKGCGWTDKTSVQNDAGSDAHWKDLDFRCPAITRTLLLEQDLVVTVMDENSTRADTLIGSASTSLVEAATQGVLGNDVDIEVDLVDSKGAPAGRLVLLCSLHPEAAKLELAPGLTEGVVKIRKIVARGLETGNRFTKNAPSVQLQYGAWEGVTAVGEGTDPMWDFLALESTPAVVADQLRTQPLTVSLFDNKKKIAVGVIENMLLAGSQAGTDVDVPVQLFHVKSNDAVGKLTLTLSVGAPSEVVVPEEKELPMPAYQEAVLLISSIKAEGLVNTEWVGKADPFVALTLGAWTDQTGVCSNAGGNVIWNDLKIREEFPTDVLVHQPMDISVYDKNKFRKNVLIGRGELSLKRVAYSLGKEVELVVQLQNEKKTKSVGKLILKLELREQAKQEQKVLPADFTKGLLHIFRISAFNLPNKELIGQQDPYVVVRLGDYADRTPTLPEAGSDPIFDLLDLKAEVTGPILQNRQLEIEVWEDNTVGRDILLGTGRATLKTVTTVGEEVELRVNLKDTRGESAGRALLLARLEDMPLTQEQEVAVPISEGFTCGTIHVRKICAFGLLNTDLFIGTKQDPYVVLKLGDWSAQTRVKDNAGTDCAWDELDMECDVDVPALQSASFEVAVMNKNNLRAHSEIGVGKVSIRRAGTQVGQLVELSVSLVNSKAGKAAGRVVLHVQVLPEEVESQYALPADFVFGHFKVSKISGFNLKNTELIGLPDPFVVLKLGDWSAKTYTQDDAPGDVTWNFLTIGCDVMREVVASSMLEVAVWDENKGRAHALIGSGSVSLLKAAAHLGQEVELKVKLVDAHGKTSGKIVVSGTLATPEPVAELPDTFVEGSLKIKRVSMFGLRNSEMFSKGDPFVRLKLNNFQVDTKVLSNAGENPVWKGLDFETTCDVKTVKVGELVVEAWEKNSFFSDKLLCSCQVPIKLASGKLGQEVELVAKMKTAKGEDRGDVNVLVQLDPIAALSAPDLGLPPGFEAGTVRIIKDPYICFTIGDWSETTDTLSSAGSSAIWTDLDMVAEVNTEILSNEKLTVRVMDENTTRRDSILGVGVASLRKLCARLNIPVETSVDLVAENGAAVGRVIVTAVLSESKLEDLAEALPVSAVVVNRAQLVVRRIAASDLKGGDGSFFGDKPDPYVQLSLDKDWISKTDFKKNAGRSAEWLNITDMELPVTGDVLKYKKIVVTVFDQNSLTKDTWMGQGEFALRKLGSLIGKPTVVSHVVRLKDKRGKSAGKVVVDAELQPLPDIAEGAKDSAANAAALQTVGVLSFLECSVSKVSETGITGKQDLQVKLAIGDWNEATAVNKRAGKESTWPLKWNTSNLAVAQLIQHNSGLQVEVLGHSVKGMIVLGKSTVPLDKAVAQPGKWVDLVSDLSSPSGAAGSCGKLRLKARFSVVGDGTDLGFAGTEAGAGDQGMLDLNNRVGSLEESIKAQLAKELAAERDSILHAMAEQHKILSASIDNLSQALVKERQSKASLLDGLVVNQVKSLKLPADVKQWRSAHVQAWISFQIELPQYAEPFQKASIDGLVLIKHITRDTLQNSLEIIDSMHCEKILEGVRVLQEKQREVDAQAERDRLKRLQAKKEEEERKRAMMAELQKQSEKKAKKDVKVKKKRSRVAKVEPKTYFGEVREQNIVERARIEREMRLYRTEKQKLQDKADLASRTWKFEYTGAPQPKVDTIWDSDPFSRQTGSSAYRRTMALDILGSENFTRADNLVRAPATIKVRPVPRNCSPEEVLALVKGAMFDVSEWLLEMDRIERRRNAAQDSDLMDANDQAFLTLLAGPGDEDRDLFGRSDPPPVSYGKMEEFSFAEGSEAPPAYEEVAAADLDDDDDDDDDVPPPAYEEVVEGGGTVVQDEETRSPFLSPSPPPNVKLMSLIYSGAGDLQTAGNQPEPERMTLVFNALVGQQNNNARWLGSNEKLTRMKLYGGFESLLRLKIEWTQFDALWTQLDHQRSGDIDVKEFSAFFGDLAEFKDLMGTQALSTTTKSKSIAALSKCLFELCDALRRAGFTVVEMFSGFDRNGSGGVSISEFCSMLRLVIGNNFEKRLIYQALSVLDSNGDKSISLEEMLRFVYRVWKSQLDELADKLSRLDEHMTGEAEKIQKIVEERRSIKEAVKKNFPREWRDRLEREGGHSIPGPFQALLQRMNVGGTACFARPTSPLLQTKIQSDNTAALHMGSPMREMPGQHQHLTFSAPFSPQQAHRSYRPSETWSPAHPPSGVTAGTAIVSSNPFTASAPRAPRPQSATAVSSSAGGKMSARQLSVAGQNEIMRFKIKVPAGCAPTRQGATLQVPAVRDLNAGTINSSEVTDSLLRKNAPFEGYG